MELLRGVSAANNFVLALVPYHGPRRGGGVSNVYCDV
jgi:hypothetical protein